MFVLCLSFYYVQAARGELKPFILWTVWARAAVIVHFAAFVLPVSAPKAPLLFGLVDRITSEGRAGGAGLYTATGSLRRRESTCC